MKEEISVLLVGLDVGEEDFEHSMEELKSLAEACEKKVVGIMTQRAASVNKAFYIGSGKVREVRQYAQECEAEEIIFDNSLSPSQIRNLGKELDMPVLDRTNLILDIFALRARTAEARMQVEIARLQYMLPRLVGMHEALGRQGGTGGSMSNKGAGETKLELDRRKIESRIARLRRELDAIGQDRQTQRKKRNASRIPQVALVGYTNAGKSTILNRMLEAYGREAEKSVLEKDMLFATLETSVRVIDPGDNKPFLLSDTVGFIHKLPHDLVKAFRSTLDEIRYADLLVQVVDFSDENYKNQVDVTRKILNDLEIEDISQIMVYNKADKCQMEDLPRVFEDCIYMAAGPGVGIRELAELIQQKLYDKYILCEFLFPYGQGREASRLMEQAIVREREYREEGLWLRVKCSVPDAERYSEYRIG